MLEFTTDAPAEVLRRLAMDGHRACALLGGAQIHALFLQARLVDELWLTLEPRLFGAGTPLVGIPVEVSLHLLSAERLEAGDSLLVKYRVARP